MKEITMFHTDKMETIIFDVKKIVVEGEEPPFTVHAEFLSGFKETWKDIKYIQKIID